MTLRNTRRPHMIDLMIVVVVSADAMGWMREYHRECTDLIQRLGSNMTDQGKSALLRGLVVPGLACGSVASLLIALRPPRDAPRRLARQPGVVASGVASMVLAILTASTLVRQGIRIWLGPPRYPDLFSDWFRLAGSSGSSAVGLSILSAWFVLWWGGRWRAEPRWIDRAGRLLGSCWIAKLGAELLLRGVQ